MHRYQLGYQVTDSIAGFPCSLVMTTPFLCTFQSLSCYSCWGTRWLTINSCVIPWSIFDRDSPSSPQMTSTYSHPAYSNLLLLFFPPWFWFDVTLSDRVWLSEHPPRSILPHLLSLWSILVSFFLRWSRVQQMSKKQKKQEDSKAQWGFAIIEVLIGRCGGVSREMYWQNARGEQTGALVGEGDRSDIGSTTTEWIECAHACRSDRRVS